MAINNDVNPYGIHSIVGKAMYIDWIEQWETWLMTQGQWSSTMDTKNSHSYRVAGGTMGRAKVQWM